MTGQLKVYSFSSSTPFMFSASTCHSATTYDSNMALYTHDGQMMIQNDDHNRACGTAARLGRCNAAGIGVDLVSELHCRDAVLPPNRYILIVGGYASSSGPFGLSLTLSPSPRPTPTFVYVPTARTWSAARADCQSRGGELATIHSAAENTQAAAAANCGSGDCNVWIGLSDTTQEGRFVWADGSASGYRNWAGGQPNNDNSNADCAQIRNNGQWDDRSCSESKRYICQMPSPPSPPPPPPTFRLS